MSETARDLIVRVAGATLDVLDGIDPIVATSDDLAGVLLRHGWTLSAQATAEPLLNALPDAAERAQLRSALESLRLSGTPDLASLAPIASAAAEILAAIRAADKPQGSLLGPFDKQLFWDTFPAELADELLVGYLAAHQPAVFAALTLAGVIREVEREGDAQSDRRRSRGPTVDWTSLPTLLTKPEELAKTAYGWGGDLAVPRLFDAAVRASRALGLRAGMRTAPRDLIASYYDEANPYLSRLQALDITIASGRQPGVGRAELSLLVLPIPAPSFRATGHPQGLWLGLRASGAFGTGVMLAPSTRLHVRGGAQDVLPPGIELLPGSVGLSSALPPSQIDAAIGFDVQPPQPWRPLGAPVGTRVEITDLSMALELQGPPADPELRLRLATSGITIIIDASAGDSFLTTIVPAAPQTLQVAGALRWSSKAGVAFEAQAALELTIPLNLVVGPIELLELIIGLQVGTAQPLGLQAGVTIKATLGPLALSVENVGLRGDLVPAADPKTTVAFDQLGVEFGFKPPDGAGVSLGAGPVKGGGFLYFDPAKEEYAGIVHLEFKALSLTAIGLLTTRLPDGAQGFSLLVIIAADLPPIQLGWGFTLTGVGGLVGINRGVVPAVLQEGIEQGSLGSVMFPQDPVANAPRILRDISAAFPPTRDQFVFGPMVALGWGTPPIIRAELGLILELPSPVRLLLLGKLMAGLPALDAPLVYLRIDVLGVLDFQRGTLEISAALVDSRVATFPLTGQFELRAGFGDRPSFLMSAGGFNPGYVPPAGFPPVERLALTIFTGENPRLRMEGYFALSTASVQAGARIDAHVHREVPALGSMTADGQLAFDATVDFSPFRVLASFGAHVVIARDGLELLSARLELQLTGPNPWRAWGLARYTFLGEREIPVDLSAGEEAAPPAIPPVDPLPALRLALTSDDAWSTALGGAADQVGVTLRTVDGSSDGSVLHPFGRVRVQQRVLPLNLALQRFGSAPVAVTRTYGITAARFGTTEASRTATTDHFAPGQFLELSEDQRLTRPAFELFDAGVELTTGHERVADTAVTADFGYATVIVDRIDPVSPPSTVVKLAPADVLALAHLGAAGAAGRVVDATERFGTHGLRVAVEEERYAVAGVDALQRTGAAPTTVTASTYSAAAQSPPAGTHVVPEHELVAP